MLIEVEAANKISVSLKEKRVQDEKNEDLRIIKYNADKELREKERLEREQYLHDEKEKEIAKMRANQEKASNRDEEIEAMRAKRAYEKAELEAREREKMSIVKRQRLLDELEVSRKRQFSDKESYLADQAKQERDEFLRIIAAQKQDEEKERKIEEQKK